MMHFVDLSNHVLTTSEFRFADFDLVEKFFNRPEAAIAPFCFKPRVKVIGDCQKFDS